MSERQYIEVVEIESGEVVQKIDVTGKGERAIERTMRGLLRQMDTERFYAKEPNNG